MVFREAIHADPVFIIVDVYDLTDLPNEACFTRGIKIIR